MSSKRPANRDIECTRLLDSLNTALDAAKALEEHMVVYLLENALAEVREVVIPRKQ